MIELDSVENVWATGTNYVKDDITTLERLCSPLGHTSDASFYTDLNATSSMVKMLDGYEWKNNCPTHITM